MKKEFAVDAALLKELGERLIGRPGIAMGELVKNSYDADATLCRIEISKDRIVIADNGTGMSDEDFLGYWMRLGTTHKVDQARSKLFGRPLTGSKGIGRLSAQFLADEMTIQSTTAANRPIHAIVDWRNAVRGQNLSKVEVDWDYMSEGVQYPGGSPTGTRITLTRLKSDWSADAIRELGDDVWMLRSPFRRYASRGHGAEDFDIELEAPDISGAQDAFNETFRIVFANWKARIQGNLERGRSGGEAIVTVEFRPDYPEGSENPERFQESLELPIRQDRFAKPLVDKATFEILIFKPEGRQPGGISVGALRKYLAEFGNVAVYDAGFRLPYYGSGRIDPAGQDWLLIAADQARRLNVSELLPEHLRTRTRYMQDLPAPGRIFGAVEIDTNHERIAAEISRSDGPFLQIQSGRDRLSPNAAFDQLRDLVRFSLDFYANRYRMLNLRVAEKARERERPSKKYDRALEILNNNKKDIPAPVFREIREQVVEARKASAKDEEALDRRAVLLAPLASAGMAALALNHEVSREGRFLNRMGERLRYLSKEYSIEELGKLADEFNSAQERLESLQELFAPLLSEDDAVATKRLQVKAVVGQAVRSMRVLMPRVGFDFSGVPDDLRFPFGSLAEWNALLQNVLSNAWNALLDSNRWEVSFRGGKARSGREWLRISDTGYGLDVPLSETGQLFEPFERRLRISDDNRSIAIGGQGLGLAIVRMIAHRRGANVGFVEPEKGFSTTFEISWRGGKK